MSVNSDASLWVLQTIRTFPKLHEHQVMEKKRTATIDRALGETKTNFLWQVQNHIAEKNHLTIFERHQRLPRDPVSIENF
jgi:hypothetical protein